MPNGGNQNPYPEGDSIMAKTLILDAQGIVRAVDSETLKPLTATGLEDFTKTDYLKVTGNGATLATGHRTVDLAASNDDASVSNVSLRLQTKGAGLTFPCKVFAATADIPAWAAWMEGALIFDAEAHKLKVATNAAWVVAGTQT